MDRHAYYAAHSATRLAARQLAVRDADKRAATHRFQHGGHHAMIFVTREAPRHDGQVPGKPAGIVIRTIYDRPLRARAAEELAHAADCRRAAACWRTHPAIQALRLREARRTLEIVRDLTSAFNHLPA